MNEALSLKYHHFTTPRKLEASPIREEPQYGILLVFQALLGGEREGLSFIEADSMVLHDYLCTLLRQLRLSQRTIKGKNPKKPTFTIYFQALPDVFATYRPNNVGAAAAVLEKWRWRTHQTADGVLAGVDDRYVAIREEDAATIVWLLAVWGVTSRIVQRPVQWGGTVRPGWMVVEGASLLAETKWEDMSEEIDKDRVKALLRIIGDGE